MLLSKRSSSYSGTAGLAPGRNWRPAWPSLLICLEKPEMQDVCLCLCVCMRVSECVCERNREVEGGVELSDTDWRPRKLCSRQDCGPRYPLQETPPGTK